MASIRLHVGEVRGVAIRISGSRFTATNTSLAALIAYAYNLEAYQVSGGPSWASDYASHGWDIAARAEGEGILATGEARQMIQTLLSDRFQVKFHRETREMPVYALVVAAKSGPKLKMSPPDATSAIYVRGGNTAQIIATKSSMEQLVRQLNVGRPVVDKTGLTGSYDFKLEWSLSGAGSNAPSIFTAVQEQLGLKLESEKAPIDVLVIDHAEKPSPN